MAGRIRPAVADPANAAATWLNRSGRVESKSLGFRRSWRDEAFVSPRRSHRCIEQYRDPRQPRLRTAREHTLLCHNISSSLSWVVRKGRHSLE